MIRVILFGVDVIQINVIQNYRIFAPKFFNFKTILARSIFKNVVSFKDFTFNYVMPQCDPVGEIRCPYIKEAYDPNVYWWYSVTDIPPDSITTL